MPKSPRKRSFSASC